MGNPMANAAKSNVQSSREVFQHALLVLTDGLEKMLTVMKKTTNSSLRFFMHELESILSFFETLTLIKDSMPDQRFQDALRNTAHSIHAKFDTLSKMDRDALTGIEMDPKTQSLLFISLAYRLIGPRITISNNEMKAWVSLEKNEAQFFSPEKIIDSLNQFGIVKGINETAIQEIFSKKLFDQQVLVAEGILPQCGQDGRVEYTFDVKSLNRAPKELANGKVSLEDINLCVFMGERDPIAKILPPVPGQPGYTIKNSIIQPPSPSSIELPSLENAQLSENQDALIASIDGCILLKNKKLVLEPNLHIQGSISYETGNISSKVLVWIKKDVLLGFSVRTEKDIYIGGVVEGAALEAKGDIMIKGGILGKEKAVIESNGTIHTKYISNAKVSALGDVIVEKEIIHSHLYVGGNVILTNPLGEIIGGEINVDGEIIANQIGSDIGVKTTIILGKQSEKIVQLLEENQQKREEQEGVQDKCLQIIDMLEMRSQQSTESNLEIENALKKAHIMLDKAETNIKALNTESDLLQAQLDDSAKRMRTIRVRKTILPGTFLSIQGIEMEITNPVGPCTVVREGDQLAFYPFQELNVAP